MNGANFPDFHPVMETDDYSVFESDQIPGLLVFLRKLFQDERGFFQELARVEPLAECLGREISVKQISLTLTIKNGLRGMHAEEQDKIVAALSGAGLLAWADLREDKESFGKVSTLKYDFTSDKFSPRFGVLVPEGVANGIMATDDTYYCYCITKVYVGGKKRAVKWNDQDLVIPWPGEPEFMSEDDRSTHPSLREAFPEKFK